MKFAVPQVECACMGGLTAFKRLSSRRIMMRNLRQRSWRPWVGDLLASAFVGFGLMWGYGYLASSFWMPVAVGYLLPALVYCFSTSWNSRRFLKGRFAVITLIMGTLFFVVHNLPIPHLIITGSGFIAPVIVSRWSRRV
jgi:hypothetical protein